MGTEQVRALRRSHATAWAVEWGLLFLVQALVALQRPAAAPLVAVVALSAGVALLGARRAAAAVGDPDGDVLLETGVRVSSTGLRSADRARRGAAVGWLAAVVGDLLVGAPPIGLVAVFVGTLAELILVRRRRIGDQLLEAWVALTTHRPDEVRRVLASFPRELAPDVRDGVEGIAAALAAREGDGSAGLAAAERRWSGGMDLRGAVVATLRAARSGDTGLAARWLAAPHARDTLYEAYLVASLRAYVALADGRGEEALAAVGPLAAGTALPPFYRRELELLAIAARRVAGRAAEADAAREQLSPPFADEAWRRTAQPWLWERLTGEVGGSPVSPPAPSRADETPFAPPPDDLPAPAAARSVVGAVPVDGMAVWTARRGTLDRVRGVGLLVLLALSPLLLGLGALLAVLADDREGQLIASLSRLVGVLGLAVGAVGAVPRWFLPRAPRPGFALDDGRVLPLSWWWVFALRGAAPVAVALGFAAAAPATGRPVLGWVFGPLLPLLAWLAWRQQRGWRLLRDTHHPDPTRMLGWPRPAWGRAAAQVGAWRALARLRAGDPAGAEAEAREASAHGPDAGFVLGWLAAGRGDAELERLLAAPDPPGLAGRYRAAVTLLLAALSTGRTPRLAGRLAEWDALAAAVPNLYGDLLARLLCGARRAAGEDPGPDPEGTAWVARAWPFVP